jgi:hypothetical protein
VAREYLFKERTAEVQAQKNQNGISKIEAQRPSSKTANLFGYRQHVQWYFRHRHKLLTFYNFEKAKDRFQAYQGSQKALEQATNILINGGKKYNPQRRRQTDRNRTLHRGRKEKSKLVAKRCS